MTVTSLGGRRLAAVGALVLLGCGASCPGPKPTDTGAPGTASAPATRVVSLFYMTSLEGWYEPCGCEPGQLGGLDRMLGLVAERSKGGAGSVLVTAGTTLAFKGEVGRRAKIRADLLADLLRDGGLAAAAPGPADLLLLAGAEGPSAPLPWIAANVEGVPGAKRHAVVEAGGLKIGLVGIAGPPEAGAPPLPAGVKLGAAAAAARAAVDAARAEGAQVIVALLDGERRDAYVLASEVAGIDFLVVGRSERPMPFAETIAGTTTRLIEAGHQGEHVGVLELHLPATPAPGAATFASGDDAAQAAAELEKIRAQITEIEARLAAAGAGAPGDLGPLLLRKRDEEKALAARAAATAPPPPPFFRHRAEPVNDKLAGLAPARARIEAYALSLAALDYEEEKPVPPPEKGAASYIGAEKCKSCHEEEYAVWSKTRHATAMVTLEEKKRDKVAECVDCHVAGFRKPGGSSLHELKGLGGVQCENCHGPGSVHEEAGGYEVKELKGGAKHPAAIKKEFKAEKCAATCHHPPHDSHFDYHRKLREGVLGPGHGDELLEKIRAAAKAGAP